MIEITKEEKAAVERLVKTQDWAVAKKILESHLGDINRIDNLGEIGKISVEAEVAGRVWLIKQLNKFLAEIGLYSQPIVMRKDTSE